MNLLESKVILTKSEKEIFIDQSSSIELKAFQFLEKGLPYYEFMVGLEFLRIRENEYYGTEKRYFGISFKDNMQTLIVFEPDKHSIFATKNEKEKQAVTELITYVLTQSSIFKDMVSTMVNTLQHENVVCEKEDNEVDAKQVQLKKLLNVNIENVKFQIEMKA
ncbi:hypothetical protein QFZ31_001220 [Neobacillus niacini]|uniref:hypothetical protein n=1 Tax=Neobacillus driksii TaxID=3035913 RepID=UPI0027805EC5|nr:hypothetical protein [Neobacillus niacini]MDQ0971342.1 hypothetical protein [Neobacillus niacini]